MTGVFTTDTSGQEVIVTGFVLNENVLVFTTTSAAIPPPSGRPLVADAEFGVAFAVRQTGTYSNTDLRNSTWRFKAMATPVLPAVYGDEGGWAFGSFALSNTREVTGGSLTDAGGDTQVIYPGGTFNVSAAGVVTGSFASGSTSGSDEVIVNGIMSPDKTMIVATFRLRDASYPNLANGLVMLQREPTVAFSTADLGGSWDLVGNLVFGVGETRKTFTVQSLMDESSGNQTVHLHLTVPAGAATLGPRANALLNIINAPGAILGSR